VPATSVETVTADGAVTTADMALGPVGTNSASAAKTQRDLTAAQ